MHFDVLDEPSAVIIYRGDWGSKFLSHL